MAKKEVYRSFEGKLGVDNQSGYIITETDSFYEIEFLSVCQGHGNHRIKIRKEYLPEKYFADLGKIGELEHYIINGQDDIGQVFYKNKWYGYDTINNIQRVHHDSNWRRYV